MEFTICPRVRTVVLDTVTEKQMEMNEFQSFCMEHSKFPCHIHVEGPSRHSVKVNVRCGYHNTEVESTVPYPFCRKPLACVMGGRCMSRVVCND